MVRALSVLALALALGASLSKAQDPAAAVDSVMAPYSRTNAPGGVVTVVQHGEVVFVRGYGMASLEQGTAITPATIFDIGSVAKQFTGFALALLAEEGALGLDDDIRDHLPDVPDFGVPITIRNLLNHTSGLREIYDAKALSGWQGGDGIEQREALSVTASMRELNFEPGTEYMYCNTAYMLLADIVSEVSGVPFPEWMQAHVFNPLGMVNTEIMDNLGEVIRGAADSYRPVNGGGFRRVFDNSSAYGQGGIYTNAADMARWMINFGSAGVGGRSVQANIRTRGVLASGDTLSYALGISVTSWLGQRVLRHGGASAGFRSSLAYFPDMDAGVFVQSNRTDIPGTLLRDVAEAFFPHALSEPQAPAALAEKLEQAPSHFEPDDLSEYVGRYFSEEIETVYAVRGLDSGLAIVHWRQGGSGLSPVETDVFTADWGRLRFERNEDGDITGFRVSTERVRNLLFGRLD